MKNPFLIYQAKSFYNAYLALEQLQPAGDELLFMVPTLVNGAFSVELAIKAILGEQDIAYGNEHNLKILFEKLPIDIQQQVWDYLATRAPHYSDKTKCDTELLLMSEAFVQWRYYYENGAPSFDPNFLAAFANATIYMMFHLGYNTFFEPTHVPADSEQYNEIDKFFEDNRKDFIEKNKNIIQRKGGNRE